MKILVIGANGQLGRSVKKLVTTKGNSKLISDFTFADRASLDLSNLDNIESYFDNNQFDTIINCAAYTLVDEAENNKELANQVNHLAVKKIAESICGSKTHLIHISTDYVFDGTSFEPYEEIDLPNPINVYGKTKLAGEIAIKRVMRTNATIIRTSWVYSEFGNNFVQTMLRLGRERDKLNVVDDQLGSPTYASDLAEVILHIADKQGHSKKELPTQIYHYSNEGNISWYDFAKEIFKLARINCKVLPILTKEFVTSADRPKNSSMSKKKIRQEFGVETCSWNNSLDKLVQLLGAEKSE